MNNSRSGNYCLRLCANLATRGGRSDAGKSVSFLCSKYHIYYLVPSMILYITCSYVIINDNFECSPETAVVSGNIDDFMYIRDTFI